jgi:hypothetical protein
MEHICICVCVAFYQMGLCYADVPELQSVDSWFESGADCSLPYYSFLCLSLVCQSS